jgi:hypothetical protein
MANCGLRIDVIASSPQRRPEAWLVGAQAKQGGVCRKTVQAFSITQTTDSLRHWSRIEHMAQPGVVERAAAERRAREPATRSGYR